MDLLLRPTVERRVAKAKQMLGKCHPFATDLLLVCQSRHKHSHSHQEMMLLLVPAREPLISDEAVKLGR